MMHWLGFFLALPLFVLLSALLRLITRASWQRLVPWLSLAFASAVMACAIGVGLPAHKGHQLWPQVAAATGAFLSFLLVWSLALWRLRER